jgi:dihydropyrimidinase
MFDLIIRNGSVVTATDTSHCDIGITDGGIAALGLHLGPATREIDATGKLVLPGGIDSHCHIEQPRADGTTNADSFESATTSAAFGGTTCVICFSPQFKGHGIADRAADYHERAKKAVIDYSFHIIITDPSPTVIDEELPPLVAAGHRSIKFFMTYEPSFLTDGQVLTVLSAARKNQAFVVIHAENHEAIKWMTARLEAAGLTDAKYHAWAKPALVEREAIQRVIALAELVDVPIQIFHVSSEEGAEEIRRAQGRGLKVYGETCTQYLAFTAADLDREGQEGSKFLCSPALRYPADQEALWKHIRLGTLGVVSSDHAPYQFEGPKGKQAIALDAPFSKIPNGVPGLETRMPFLFSEGVLKGRIDLQTFVAITATNPAKLFGLHPRKGSIACGMDADLAIWDPTLSRTVTNAGLHHAVDHTPYEGMTLTGWPITTLVRGQVVIDGGARLAGPGHGQFQPRGTYPMMQPRNVFPTPFDPHAGPNRL